MECNKDEAARAKEIAEKKLTEKDFAGAKKFALKAQNLFAGLEGLPQFMATLDVYIAAEKKINGEVDWYGILGVDPFADDETLKRQYRTLALTLHPDKNKSVGAEGAFKIILEAWSLFSDKAKRVEYDQKRKLRVMNHKNTMGNASMPAGNNGFHTYTDNNNSSLKDQKRAATPQSPSVPPHPSKANTFWTACKRCKMQYEYLRAYINQNLRCPNCQEPFCAVEMPALPRDGHNSSTPRPSYQQQQNVKRHLAKNTSASGGKPPAAPNGGTPGSAGVGSINSPNIQQHTFSRPGGVRIVPGSGSSAGQNANLFHPASQNVGEESARRKSSAFQKMGARLASQVGSPSAKGDRPTKKGRIEVNVTGREPNQAAMGNGGVGQGNVSGYQMGSSGTERLSAHGTVKQKSSRGVSQLEIRNLLAAKSRMEIRKKLNEWSMEAALKDTNKQSKKMAMEKTKAAVDGGKKDGSKTKSFADTKNSVQPRKSSLEASNVDSDEKQPAEVMLMSVPDPEFYDFDKDRIEKSFGENQVWAAYDDDDGMPRYYALIHKVVSKRPFRMQISWLNSKSNAELGPLNWVSSGFSKTTGEFRIGKHIISKNLNSFSHRVKWMKGKRGAIQIFPRKGDVWALYRNWSPDWNELTEDEVIHKYNMVQVLEDYDEERGVAVAPLVKVAGFKSVFHQHLDLGKVKRISREEMFRFSHHILSYVITGQEAINAPQGCLELDPAALPVELLQVITEAEEVETEEKAKQATKEGEVDGVGKVKEDLHLEESGRSTAQEGLGVRFKYVYRKGMARKAKESKEEEMVTNTNEGKE